MNIKWGVDKVRIDVANGQCGPCSRYYVIGC
jgi:hypothetical protein